MSGGDWRQAARDLLAQRFADGVIDLETYEKRIDAVEAAPDVSTLKGVIVDLRDEEEVTTALVATNEFVLPARRVEALSRVRTIMGSTKRSGAWDVPRKLEVGAYLGSVQLDLRDARLPAEGATIEVSAFMAEVEIFVPPGMRVAMETSAILGEAEDAPTDQADPKIPRLRVTGTVVLASVTIHERHSGESGWGAFWRRRRESRRRRAALSGRKQSALPPKSDS